MLDELIDWSAVPEDPIYQLVFPQPGMIPASDLAVLADRAGSGGSRADGDRFLQLRFLQAGDPRLVGRPFRARMLSDAAWLDALEVLPGVPEDLRAAVATA